METQSHFPARLTRCSTVADAAVIAETHGGAALHNASAKQGWGSKIGVEFVSSTLPHAIFFFGYSDLWYFFWGFGDLAMTFFSEDVQMHIERMCWKAFSDKLSIDVPIGYRINIVGIEKHIRDCAEFGDIIRHVTIYRRGLKILEWDAETGWRICTKQDLH